MPQDPSMGGDMMHGGQLMPSEQPKVKSCWLKTSTRGVGAPISACPADKEKSGALCYPKCKENFRGIGPVCWPDCPEGYRDDGAFCFKPKPYGRGVGSFSGGDDKEKWGLLWYPKCSEDISSTHPQPIQI